MRAKTRNVMMSLVALGGLASAGAGQAEAQLVVTTPRTVLGVRSAPVVATYPGYVPVTTAAPVVTTVAPAPVVTTVAPAPVVVAPAVPVTTVVPVAPVYRVRPVRPAPVVYSRTDYYVGRPRPRVFGPRPVRVYAPW